MIVRIDVSRGNLLKIQITGVFRSSSKGIYRSKQSKHRPRRYDRWSSSLGKLVSFREGQGVKGRPDGCLGGEGVGAKGGWRAEWVNGSVFNWYVVPCRKFVLFPPSPLVSLLCSR